MHFLVYAFFGSELMDGLRDTLICVRLGILLSNLAVFHKVYFQAFYW